MKRFKFDNIMRLVLFVQVTLVWLCRGDFQDTKKPPHPHIIFVTLRDMVSCLSFVFRNITKVLVDEVRLQFIHKSILSRIYLLIFTKESMFCLVFLWLIFLVELSEVFDSLLGDLKTLEYNYLSEITTLFFYLFI